MEMVKISDSESFDNLAEYDSRVYGKRLAIDTIPNGSGLISYGSDAITAQIEENGLSPLAAKVFYTLYSHQRVFLLQKR